MDEVREYMRLVGVRVDDDKNRVIEDEDLANKLLMLLVHTND